MSIEQNRTQDEKTNSGLCGKIGYRLDKGQTMQNQYRAFDTNGTEIQIGDKVLAGVDVATVDAFVADNRVVIRCESDGFTYTIYSDTAERLS